MEEYFILLKRIFFRKVKQEWQEVDICLAEILVTLPKPPEENRIPVQKILTPFTAEGKKILFINASFINHFRSFNSRTLSRYVSEFCW
jgi:hypothetical protein